MDPDGRRSSYPEANVAAMTDHRGPIPVPARITQALDAIGAEGPWVDEALGGAEPMVDEWEDGLRVPTPAQVELLAKLTKMPVAFFYKPVQDWEMQPARMFLCQMGRRGDNGLTILETHIDYAGVQHVKQLTPDRPPYRPRKPKTAAAPPAAETVDYSRRHAPNPDPDVPGCCGCGLALGKPNERHTSRR